MLVHVNTNFRLRVSRVEQWSAQWLAPSMEILITVVWMWILYGDCTMRRGGGGRRRRTRRPRRGAGGGGSGVASVWLASVLAYSVPRSRIGWSSSGVAAELCRFETSPPRYRQVRVYGPRLPGSSLKQREHEEVVRDHSASFGSRSMWELNFQLR